jgi:hypothetical protein
MKDENRFLTFSEWLSEKGMTKKEYNKEMDLTFHKITVIKNIIGRTLIQLHGAKRKSN